MSEVLKTPPVPRSTDGVRRWVENFRDSMMRFLATKSYVDNRVPRYISVYPSANSANITSTTNAKEIAVPFDSVNAQSQRDDLFTFDESDNSITVNEDCDVKINLDLTTTLTAMGGSFGRTRARGRLYKNGEFLAPGGIALQEYMRDTSNSTPSMAAMIIISAEEGDVFKVFLNMPYFDDPANVYVAVQDRCHLTFEEKVN